MKFFSHYSVALFLLPVLLSACGKEGAPPVTQIARPASTVVVGTAGEEASTVYSGEVRARHEATLAFRLAGKLIERSVDVGTQVKRGQVLARLDGGDSALQVSASEAQLQLAEADIKRQRELHAKGFVSQAALDAKEAALKAAAAQTGLARNQSSYTSLRAEQDGVVAATLAEVGQVVAAGQAVVRVAQQGEREVAIAIPEAQLSQVKLGMPVQVEAAGATLAGRVRELSPVADAASRTYPARIAFSTDKTEVALGMTARVQLLGKPSSGLRVPLTALFQRGNQTALWIVAADHRVSLRPVTVAAYLDEGVLIASGVVAGERIVSAGVHKLTAGEKIQVLENGKAL